MSNNNNMEKWAIPIMNHYCGSWYEWEWQQELIWECVPGLLVRYLLLWNTWFKLLFCIAVIVERVNLNCSKLMNHEVSHKLTLLLGKPKRPCVIERFRLKILYYWLTQLMLLYNPYQWGIKAKLMSIILPLFPRIIIWSIYFYFSLTILIIFIRKV